MTGRTIFKRIYKPIVRSRGMLAMSFGRVRSARPLSKTWGARRGTPIDRYYLEGFLACHSDDVRGRVLEIGDDSYSRRFGGSRITQQDILHVTGDGQSTIVGDLTEPDILPERSFDCIIFTQTLHLIFDVKAAIGQLHRALRPGGVLLVTTPGITPVGQGEWGPYWCWSLTQNSLSRLLCGPFDAHNVTVQTYGNLAAATAFLHAAVTEEVGRRRLARVDPRYPVMVVGRAVA
jgi:SAM-dependent methyltransferase